MTAPIPSVLNPSVGIQDLLPLVDAQRLPDARDLPASSLHRSGLEALYNAANTHSGVESLLCPDVGDGRVVSPEVFEAQLTALVAKLKESPNPKVKALLENEILPILQNGMLLNAYRGLMLGG